MMLLLLVISPLVAGRLTVPMTDVNDWGGRFQGQFNVHVNEAVDGWEAIIRFSIPVTNLDEWMGDIISHSSNNTEFTIVNKPHTSVQKVGDTLQITVQGAYAGSKAPSATMEFINMGHDPFTAPPPHKNTDEAKYNYDEVLMKSIMFYEAQRSGKLPTNNRIQWRSDSALNDRGNNGEDLTGGWYDAGDHVKFNFPMAASTTLLTWGLLEFKDGYNASEELDRMYDCIKWPLDYLLKCHVSKYEYYVQVGDGSQDHSYWGRPENMTMPRPAFKITQSSPGSDIAGETAATFAAGYLAFHNKNLTYANILLTHAKDMYDFAINYKAKYSESVNQAAGYYRSSDYEDELCWGGVWLFLATRNQSYLTEAEKHYESGAAWGQSWDEKNTGCMILLYKATHKEQYKQDIEATFRSWMPGGSIPYTPAGLAWRSQWGANRYAANMAMMALMAAEQGLNATEYRKWAESQINYILGDNGRSFVVGFGQNPPERPHHRGSSCPLIPAPCSYFEFQQPGPNPHVLYGALVGGPDQNDGYADKRDDYVKNEVACDYNAGFQSAVADTSNAFIANCHCCRKRMVFPCPAETNDTV